MALFLCFECCLFRGLAFTSMLCVQNGGWALDVTGSSMTATGQAECIMDSWIVSLIRALSLHYGNSHGT